jgi:hypothetical protein
VGTDAGFEGVLLTAQMKSKTMSISMTVIVWWVPCEARWFLETQNDGDGGVYMFIW